MNLICYLRNHCLLWEKYELIPFWVLHNNVPLRVGWTNRLIWSICVLLKAVSVFSFLDRLGSLLLLWFGALPSRSYFLCILLAYGMTQYRRSVSWSSSGCCSWRNNILHVWCIFLYMFVTLAAKSLHWPLLMYVSSGLWFCF